MSGRRQALAVFLVSAAVTATLLIDFCGWIYGCGCRSLWAGADAHCNIHVAGARHCPWCAIGLVGFTIVFVNILAVQALIAFRAPGRWPVRMLLSLLAFPGVGLIEAGVLGWIRGYWV